MDDHDWLAERFEGHRPHLTGVAYRMLGSAAEADDAVQESWVRLSRSDTRDVENLKGWLTTVVARVSLDMLRSRGARREQPWEVDHDELPAEAGTTDPAHEAELADSVGLALLVVLETLTPAERLAFVLHDLFAMPFAEIAPIVDRSPDATKMLASRARRRVRDAGAPRRADTPAQREVVEAFLAASRNGDFDRLVALLDPGVVLRADDAGVRTGAEREVVGASAVASTFAGRARAARPALVDGVPGLVWSQGGVPRVVFAFTVDQGRITRIDLLAEPDELASMDLALLDD